MKCTKLCPQCQNTRLKTGVPVPCLEDSQSISTIIECVQCGATWIVKWEPIGFVGFEAGDFNTEEQLDA